MASGEHRRERPRASTANTDARRSLRMAWLALPVLAAMAAPAGAGDTWSALLGEREGAEVRAAIDGATIALADGRVVRLAAIRAADLLAGRGADRATAQLAARARQTLADLVDGRLAELAALSPAPDRHGRFLAQVVAGGLWLQAELLGRGLARVDPRPEDRAVAAALLASESAARADGRGLWSLPSFRILSADEAARGIDSFQLVEGRVRAVGRSGGRLWLNFGDDWRTDFTVLVPAAVRRLFAPGALDPAEYAGTMIRVRGWIKSRNGPLIELTLPEQIEVIER